VQDSPLSGQTASGGGEGVGDWPETPTPEQLKELRAKAAKADENWDKYLRIVADFDNYKKRAARERADAVRYANEALIEKLLPIVDNFEAALAASNAPSAKLDLVRQGVSMIGTQLKGFLAEAGLEEVDAAGKPFDPNLHEAVSEQPSDDVPEGYVAQQMRKGYKLRERLLRPAMVVVAKKA
jgi:molecular chaperone GrpE